MTLPTPAPAAAAFAAAHPVPPAAPTPDFPPGHPGPVLAGFRADQIQPPEISTLYRVAMGAVAVAMVLLPLIYLGLIGATCWGVYWYSTNANQVIGDLRDRAYIFAYVGPLFAGGALVFFMVKPLFARRPKEAEPVLLTREQEPAVWALVEKICDAVRAPKPKTIAVDCQVNASASFQPRLSGFFGGNLRLTIGLPLATGLKLEELAGVLAHEFGHFAQGGGMRLSFVTRTISYWFARAVYERDSWDIRLASLGEIGLWGVLLSWIAMGLVWLGRRVLWVLMWVGFAISSYLLRQMEFDADGYETRLVGSDAFSRTSRRIVQLSVGSQRAWQLVGENFKAARLPGNVPALIATCTNRLPADVVQRINEGHAAAKTGLFDTHPSNRDREAAAQKLALPGIYACGEPATRMFRDFAALARVVTEHEYAVVSGADMKNVTIVDTDVVDALENSRVDAIKNADDLFLGLVHCAIELPLDPQPMADATALEQARAALTELQTATPGVGESVAAWRAAREKVEAQAAAAALLSGGFPVIARKVPLAENLADGASAYQQLEVARRRADECAVTLTPARKLVADAVNAVIRARLARAPDEATASRLHAQWRTVCAINAKATQSLKFREHRNALGFLLQAMQGQRDVTNPLRIAESLSAEFRPALHATVNEFGTVPYPLPDAPSPTATLKEVLDVTSDDNEHPLVTTFRRLDCYLDGTDEIQRRLIGQLAEPLRATKEG